MNDVAQQRPLGLLQVLDRAPSGGPAFVAALREEARSALRERGLPGKKDEQWRFTSVQALTRCAYEPAAAADTRLAEGAAAESFGRLGEDGCFRVLVVDGRPVLEPGVTLPEGLSLASLAQVLADEPARVEPHLGKYAGSAHFAGLNAAMFTDGVVLRVAPGRTLERPVHLVHVTARASEPTVAHPRLLVLVEENAEAQLIETFFEPADEGGRHLTNLVSELLLAQSSRLEHVSVHLSSDHHIARHAVHQERASAYRSRVFTFGGALLRLDVHVTLAGEGANVELDGLYHVTGSDHVDHQLVVEHRAPRCDSHQTYRGVIDDAGAAVFDGTAIVHRDAQRTEAHQENRNLLLSDTAVVNTKPHLRIDADDVKCSHGATVGSLDEEQLFFLRARGIAEPTARAMLTFAFLQAIVDRVSHEPTRQRIAALLLARLPGAEDARGDE